MASTKKISFDIDIKTLRKLDEIATIADRSRSYILNELIAGYLDELAGFYISSLRFKITPESEYLTLEEARERIKREQSQGKGGRR
jgi:predicted DNA-binding protein